MANLTIAKFVVHNKTLYVKVQWEKNENELFTIKVFDGTNSWSGRYSHVFADKFRQGVDETTDEYISNVRRVLSETNSSYGYVFNVMPDDPKTATFSWNKKYEGSTGTRVHGSVPVHLDEPAESKTILIDHLLQENQELKDQISEFSNRNDIMSQSLNECRSKFEQFVHIKNSLETNLYGKFAQLLNSKKRRILLLEENLKICNKYDIEQDLD